VLIPALAAPVLALLPGQAARLNIAAAAATLLAVLWAVAPGTAGGGPAGEGWLRTDAFNIPLLLASGVVGLGTAVFSFGDVGHEGFDRRGMAQYHAAFQAFLASHNLALLSDNLGVMWVAIEAGTLATVLMVAMHRTLAATEAAWKFFVLCGTGIAVALLGIVVLSLAGAPLLAEPSLSFAALRSVAARADAALLNLAFVLLLVGFGTKAGLVPLHSWLPDAHAEGPTPIAAILSGLLLNAAMLAILRSQAIVAQNPAAIAPGAFLLALGIASLLVAALALWRRRDAKRLFGWSSIEHMGLVAIAFGLGAAGVGLFHLLAHSLLKSAVFFGVGRATRLKGGQTMAMIGGLAATHPVLGWGLALAILGVAGLPPFALFVAEFWLAMEAGRAAPWVLAPLLLGLVIATGGLIVAMQRLCLGPPTPAAAGMEEARAGLSTLAPLIAHLSLAALLAFALPAPLAALLGEATRMLAP
jgi:hydrogenase-4 component F